MARVRNSLIAAALLAAPTGAIAHGDDVYGRIITTEPRIVLLIGGRHCDGFRILYQAGRQHYWWTCSHLPRNTVIWVPRPVVHHAYPPRHFHRGDWLRTDWPHARRGHCWHHGHDGLRDHCSCN